MKTDILKPLILCVGLLVSSCSDSFIELTPKDQSSSETFFKTVNGMNQALIATYVPLRDFLVNDFYVAELRSDNTHYDYRPSNQGTAIVFRQDIADFINTPVNNYVNAVYFHLYKVISRANIVLDRSETATLEDADRKRIVGEAKFLRAFAYYKLVRYFGGVPLYLHEVSKSSDSFVKRSSEEEVYKVILDDVNTAIANLAPVAKFPQSGYATKGAAVMLKADVLVSLKQYAEAEKLLKSLSGMGYGLLDEYADVFKLENKNSKESIFEVQYMQGLQGGQQSDLIYRFLPRSKNTEIITGVKTDNGGIGGWGTPTDDLIRSYEPGDKRLDASIGFAEGSFNDSYDFVFTGKTSIQDYLDGKATKGIPYVKKFVTPHVDKSNTDDNWPIYRYSEALLLLAEVLNEQGRGEEALPYINKVRNRAGLGNVTVTDKAQLQNIILKERRAEFAFENHRWPDLVRSGKAIEIMTAYGKELKKTQTYLHDDTYQITKEKFIYPIPFSEIEIYPELTQNPGY
jgi:tetratricopeptide (TPR) repeat protein